MSNWSIEQGIAALAKEELHRIYGKYQASDALLEEMVSVIRAWPMVTGLLRSQAELGVNQ